VVGALRERLGLHAVPNLAAGLRLVAPVAFVIAAGFATSDLVLGNRTAAAITVAAAWIAATLARLVRPGLGGGLTGLAWLTTSGGAVEATLVPLTIPTDYHPIVVPQHPGRFLTTLLFGLIAVLGALAPGRRPSIVERAIEPLLVAALAGAAVLAAGGIA